MVYDHLGDVRLTFTDRKIPKSGSGFRLEPLSISNYYPFGLLDKYNSWTNSVVRSSRYGYTGMEKDNDIKGTGVSYTTEFRFYDARIGRWLSRDPITKAFESAFAGMGNNPIVYSDPQGADIFSDFGSWCEGAANTVGEWWNGTDDTPLGPAQKGFGSKVGEFFSGARDGAVEGAIDTKDYVSSLSTMEGWENTGKGIIYLAKVLTPNSQENFEMSVKIANYIFNLPNKSPYQLGHDVGYLGEKTAEAVLISKGVGIVSTAVAESGFAAECSAEFSAYCARMNRLLSGGNIPSIPVFTEATAENKMLLELNTHFNEIPIPNDLPMLLDPQNINFMQNSISNITGEYTVLGNAEALSNGTLNPEVLRMNIWADETGNIWSLDNRRLAAFRLSGLQEAPVNWVNPSLREITKKMTTTNGGTSIILRGTGKVIK